MASPESTDKNDWTLIRERWIIENLDPERAMPYTLKEAASDHGVAYQTVRNRASQEGWRHELRDRQRERSRDAIEKAKSRFAFVEAEIRGTHAYILEHLSGALFDGIEEAGGLKTAELTEKQKVELLVLMLKGQREALGLATTTRLEHGFGGDPIQRETQNRLREFMRRWQAASEDDDPTDEGPDADPA